MIDSGIFKPSGVLQLKGGIAEDLATVNPLLSAREVAVETDTGQIKVGNGTDRWNNLPYAGGSSTQMLCSKMNVTLTAENISQKYLVLPSNCDTSKLLTVYLQGLLTEQGTDWELKQGNLSWDGLELEKFVRVGDKIFINYFKR